MALTHSQDYEANGFVVISGQIPVDPATGTVPEGIVAQTDQSCKSVGAILAAAEMDFSKAVKTTCLLPHMEGLTSFDKAYAKYFASKSGRSCVAVKDLPKGVLCEFDAIAVKMIRYNLIFG